MQLFKINSIQRFVLIISSIALALFQFSKGEEGTFLSIILILIFLIIAFSGDYKFDITISKFGKLIFALLFLISIIFNVLLYSDNKVKEKQALKNYDYILENNQLKKDLASLKSKIASFKTLDRISKRSGIPIEQLRQPDN